MKKELLFAMALLLLAASPATAKEKRGRANREMVAKEIAAGSYTIKVDRATPSVGSAQDLNSLYYLRVRNGNIDSFLPYFGRIYTTPPAAFGGQGEGLTFEGKAENYSVEEGKRGEKNISFRVSTDQDVYTFSIEISKDGAVSMNVSPENKSGIMFSGIVDNNERY